MPFNTLCVIRLLLKNNFLLNWQPVQVFRGLADLLFNLYINELLWSMTTDFSDPLFLPDGTKLNCLLYTGNQCRSLGVWLICYLILYINELLWSMTTDFSDPLFLPDGTKLNCLLYADDFVLLTKSKQGLEHCLTLYPHFVRSG